MNFVVGSLLWALGVAGLGVGALSAFSVQQAWVAWKTEDRVAAAVGAFLAVLFGSLAVAAISGFVAGVWNWPPS